MNKAYANFRVFTNPRKCIILLELLFLLLLLSLSLPSSSKRVLECIYTHIHISTFPHFHSNKQHKYKHISLVNVTHTHTHRTFLLFDCVFIFVISATSGNSTGQSATLQTAPCPDNIFYCINILLQTLSNFTLTVNRFSFNFYEHIFFRSSFV